MGTGFVSKIFIIPEIELDLITFFLGGSIKAS
jgi:hypothetical protein